jgi:hypothetical protein
VSARNAELLTTLKDANATLRLYVVVHPDAYIGGTDSKALMRKIDAIIAEAEMKR